MLDIQDDFEYGIKKYERITDNPLIKIYGKKMKLLGSIKNKITWYENV